jgi:hypothetical protein
MPEIKISFGPKARSADVTPFSLQVLRSILEEAGLTKASISSTARKPSEQARVMFENLEAFGVEKQKKLYKEPGQKVIAVYARAKEEGEDADTIQARMTAEILRLGPMTVSHHASDPKILNVFDVAPSSIADRKAFIRAVHSEHRVSKFLLPPEDPGFHLEIPQPGGD